MEAVNGAPDGGGPPPPSPLTGCYLLVVIGEPHSPEHKEIILRRVAKGLLSWDLSDCMVDLEKELAIITDQAPEGEEARYGERLIQYASENLVTEILIHPAVSTLSQCVRNLLSSFTRHRHIIHSGYTFAANGSWALQDGTFSLADFAEAFQELDVQRVIRAYDNGISVDIHCSPEGDWPRLPKEAFAKNCKLRLNPVDVLPSSSPAIADFLAYVTPFLVPLDIITALESSEVVGNIRFSHPTLYVFPGGQGDAALFGINGFNMLLDGGFSRKACFWDFVRHLDRLDAVLLTRLNNSNVSGITSVLKRKRQNAVYPQIGHFFCNIQERKALLSPDGDKDRDPLLIDLLAQGHDIVTNLKHLSLQPQTCYRDAEPINLYHKVGHGTLDMYVLSPARDSREVREFVQKWNTNDARLFANPKGKEFAFPLPNLVSICALLVWQPSNSAENITRILFPGSSPQGKIFEGLDRLKQLDCVKYPVCSEASLNPPKKTKEHLYDAGRLMGQRILPDVKKEKSPRLSEQKPKDPKPPAAALDNKTTDAPAEIKKEIKKSDSTDSDKSAAKPNNKIDSKPAAGKDGKTVRGRDKDSKSIERKPATTAVPITKVDKKPSPTTPKKSLANGDAPKPRAAAVSPSATPAKSAKEASNRKVLESKKQAPKKEAKPAVVEKKEPEKKVERKPISRRPKPAAAATTAVAAVAPVVKAATGSPIRKKPDSIATKKAKLDKEGTTDSSTVSTPTADADVKRDLSKLTPEELDQLKAQELADLQEEQEVVQEIEAVFRKGEEREASQTELRQIKNISIEEKTDEEYLVVEKVEMQEDEIQKLTRDSEESEKQRKLSEPKVEEVVKEVASPEEKVDKVESATQPDEKFSATIESGATTAPTLPEDERIPLDEIKEKDDTQVIEEKHVKEDTKEKETIPVTIQVPSKSMDTPPAKIPPVVGIRLDKQQHIRDIVKTPDEVADLPVDEVADQYVEYQKTSEEQAKVDAANKTTEEEVKAEVKAAVDEIIAESKEIIENNEAEEKQDNKHVEDGQEHITEVVKAVETTIETVDKVVETKAEVSNLAVEETISEVQKTAVDISTELSKEIIETNELVVEQIDEEKLAEEDKESAIGEETKEQVEILKDETKTDLVPKPEVNENEDIHKKKSEDVKEPSDDQEKDVDEAAKEHDAKEASVDLSHDINQVVDKTQAIAETSVDAPKEFVDETSDEVVESAKADKVTPEKVEETVSEEKVETFVTPVKADHEEIMKEVVTKTDITTETIENLTKNVEKVTKESIEKIETVAKDVVQETKKSVAEVITVEVDKVKETTSEIKESIEKIVDAKADEAQFKIDTISSKTKELKETIDETIAQKVVTMEAQKQEVNEKVEETKTAITTKTAEIKESVVSKAEEVSKTADAVIEEALSATHETQEAIIEAVNETITAGTDRIEDVQKTAAATAKEAISTIEQSTKEIQSAVREDAEKIVESVKETVITEAVTKTTAIKDTVVETISKVSQDIGSAKEAVATEVKETVAEKAEAVGGFFSKTFDKLAETTKAIGDKLSEEVGKVIGETKDNKDVIEPPTSIVVESVDADMINESPASPCPTPFEFIDKHDLGRKSPAEREQDVAKIVASVAEVLKSEAPLEDFKGKIPLEITTFPTFSPYTTELRETHITTVDSPTTELPGQITPIKEEKEMEEDFDSNSNKSTINELIKSSNELLEASSKIITGIKERKDEDTLVEEDEEKDDLVDSGTVHRMLVTASSEDGGEETVICPAGSITFAKSTESSERSSPELRKDEPQKQEVSSPESSQDAPSVLHKEPEISAKMLSEDIPEKKDKIDEDVKKPVPQADYQDNKVLEDATASGKSTPELQKSGKASPEQKVSGKSPPELPKSGKQTPDAAKASGKSTPDIPSKDKSGLATPEPPKSGKSTPDVSQEIKVSSGVATPEPQKSGKSTPDVPFKDDSKAPSGKTTPEPSKTGKSTPDVCAISEKSLEDKSGKSTPDIKSADKSGKSTPDIKSDLKSPDKSGKSTPGLPAEEKVEKSRKSTPSLPDDIKADEKSGKSTPDLKVENKASPILPSELQVEEVGRKSTPELQIDMKLDDKSGKSTPELKPERKSDVASGKATPDLADSKQSSGKATPEPLEKASRKSSPDVDLNGKVSPETGMAMSTSTAVSSIDSGKVSPETGIFTSDTIEDTIKPETTSITTTSTTATMEAAVRHTDERKESITSAATTTTMTTTEKVSGKSSPDLPKSGTESPNLAVCCRRPDDKLASDTDIGEHLMDGPTSGRSTPEVNNISGKSSPDAKISSRKDSHVEKSPQVSGKVTPDVSKSGISSPDFGKGDSIKLDTDSLASGKVTPDVNVEQASSIAPHMDTDSLASGKITPDAKHDFSSGKATPECDKQSAQIETDSLASGIISPDVATKSGKSTPDVCKRELPASGKSTPDAPASKKSSIQLDDKQLSGKTTPDVDPPSGKATPDVLHIDEKMPSGKSTPDMKAAAVPSSKRDSIVEDDKLLSGKSTPDVTGGKKASIATDDAIHAVIATVDTFDAKQTSGKLSPDMKQDHSKMRKDNIEVVDTTSGKSTPESLQKDAAKSPTPDSALKVVEGHKLPSGKASPEPIKSEREETGVPSEKSSPMAQAKRDSIATDEKLPSGTSTPAKKDSMHLDDKASIASGKSTPDYGKLDTMTVTDRLQSGKSTPDAKKEETDVSGKSTPDKLQPSGKSTPLSPDHQNGLSRDSIPSGKSTPGLSGKVTPEPDLSSGKATPDPTKLGSGKTTPDVKLTSGKTTPDSVLNGTSILTTSSSLMQSSTTVVESIKQQPLSGSQSPDLSKRGSLQAEHVLSGKSTPDGPKLGAELLSGKSTPDFGKRSSMQAEHILSGKSTPDQVARKGSVPIASGQSTPHTGKSSPDVHHLTEAQGKLTETVTTTSTTAAATSASSFDVTQLQSAHVFRELMEETITSSFEEKSSLNGDVIHEKHDSCKLETVTETIGSGKSTPELAKDSRKSSVLSAADESDYRKFSITSENTKTSSLMSGKSTPETKDESKQTVQAFIDAERVTDSTPSPAKASATIQAEVKPSGAFAVPDPMSTSFYGALPEEDDDVVLPSTVSDPMTSSCIGQLPTTSVSSTSAAPSGDSTEEVVKSWGKPLGLPSPAPPGDNKGTPKKERRLPANVSVKNKLNQRSDSPSKKKKYQPIYVDLTYVPHHGNSYYSQVDFFKRVRARYYVFSGTEPSKEVYNALLEAKQTWEDKELEVTIIPTYDTDVLGYWVAENEEALTKYKIDLSPSASRCTINLQDHETSCSAYRLEF